MKRKLSTLTAILLAVLIFGVLAAVLGGCDNPNDGFPGWTLNGGITAAFSDNGSYGFILTIDGNGQMSDFTSKKDAPWHGKSGRVTQIDVLSGITHIASNSFTDCVAVKSVVLPLSVTSIGANAFSDKTTVYAYANVTVSDSATVYIYSQSQPTTVGNYWHMVDGVPTMWPTVGKPVKILFIGNSYTYYNDMPVLFNSIVGAAGATVEVEFITMGSQRLYQWADVKDEMGAQLDAKLKATRDYDIIVLQEQSTYPINHYDEFLSGAQSLANKIASTQTNCQVYLYQTWGSPLYGPNHGGIPAMELKLRTAYENVAQQIGAKVSYVGKAFTFVYENHTNINLYNADNTHPSYEGSFLSACVHVATLLGVDPTQSTFVGELNQATATLLKTVAYNIVF